MKQILEFRLNGCRYREEIDPGMTLLEFIRERAGFTGTKKGCDNGDCGACTVLLDGKAILSCMMLAIQANGREVLTIEGLAPGGDLHPVQRAFIEAGAIQCGYCTPGMVMAAVGLLAENLDPTEEEIRSAMVGHLCRCTGYVNIAKAVGMAAKKLAECRDSAKEEA